MDLLIVLAAGLLPPLFILLYIRHLDTEPEPTGQIVKATVFGIIACVPIIVAEIIIAEILYSGVDMSGLRGSVLQAFLGASLPEEAFKLLALWLVLRNNRHFNQHFDGIVYAVCVGLGFAAVENVSYLLSNIDEWQATATIRALYSIPGHYAFAVLMGYYYSLYHFSEPTTKNRIYILLMPVVAHGCYDTIAFAGNIHPILEALNLIILTYFCIKLHKICQQKLLLQLAKDKEEAEMQAAQAEQDTPGSDETEFNNYE